MLGQNLWSTEMTTLLFSESHSAGQYDFSPENNSPDTVWHERERDSRVSKSSLFKNHCSNNIFLIVYDVPNPFFHNFQTQHSNL